MVMAVCPQHRFKYGRWEVVSSTTEVRHGDTLICCAPTRARAEQIAGDHNALVDAVVEVLDTDHIRWRGRTFDQIRDELFTRAVADAPSIAEAARSLGVPERSLYGYRQEPEGTRCEATTSD